MKRSQWIDNWQRHQYKWCEECDHIIWAADGICRNIHPFEIVSNPTIRWDELYTRRFNIVEPQRERMAEALLQQEEAAMIRLQEAAENFEQNQRPNLEWAANAER